MVEKEKEKKVVRLCFPSPEILADLGNPN